MNEITFRIESYFADQIDELVTRGIFVSRGELIRVVLRELFIFTRQNVLFPSFEHSRKEDLPSDEKMKLITTKLTDNGLEELKRIIQRLISMKIPLKKKNLGFLQFFAHYEL